MRKMLRIVRASLTRRLELVRGGAVVNGVQKSISAGCCRGDNPSHYDLLWQLRDPFTAQQKLVEHLLDTDSCGVLRVLFSFERYALKAWRYVAEQVLSIVRSNAQLKLVMRPTTVPLGR